MDTCFSECVKATHQLRRVGVCWILMGCLGRTVSRSVLLYFIPCQACGLLSCEHTASIKDLFISLFELSFASWCEKGSFTEAVTSNSHSSQFYQLLPIGCNWELVGIQVLIINASSMWFVRIRWRNYVSCSCLSARDSPNRAHPFGAQHADTHAITHMHTCMPAVRLQTVVGAKHSTVLYIKCLLGV